MAICEFLELIAHVHFINVCNLKATKMWCVFVAQCVTGLSLVVALVLVASLLVANQTVSVTASHLFRADFFTYKGFSIGTDMISAFWP